MRSLGVLLALAVPFGCTPAGVGGTRTDGGDDRDAGGRPRADGGAAPSDGGGEDDVDAEPDSPPFTCEVTDPGSPRLGAVVRTDPADPHPGDTLVVVVHSYAVDARDAPQMTLHVRAADGERDVSPTTIAGGKAVYYFAVSALALGDVCLEGIVDGAADVAARVPVTPRPAPPAGAQGIYKVVANHQWSCDEEVENGVALRAVVRGADGNPVPGAVVRLDWPATVERPIYNDRPPPEQTLIPPSMVTNDEGVAELMTELGDGNRFPKNEHGYMVFNLSVDGAVSDVATEITTGWWEADAAGCRYCDGTRNVWGHWSHTVEFQLDPAATEACVVPSDHQGMTRCSVIHIHHDPDRQACWAIDR